MLEKDEGDPWGTRHMDRPRISCDQMTSLVCARRNSDKVELIFSGQFDQKGSFGCETDPNVSGMYWYQRIRLQRGLPWIEFDMDILWKTSNRRIRVVFSSRSVTDKGLYKIPYGILERPRYEMEGTNLWSPNGDWPATYFAATLPNKDIPGIAVINTGTPSVRVEDGSLMYSVLRSPGFAFCLLDKAQEHPMPVAEMSDPGFHHFTFALMPHTVDNLPEILEAGYILNRATPVFKVPETAQDKVTGLRLNEPGVYITSVKPAYEGDGIAIRLVEQIGKHHEVAVGIPPGFRKAELASIMEERRSGLTIRNNGVKLSIKPYEIRTLILESEAISYHSV
jgi:alpha-mannosidase